MNAYIQMIQMRGLAPHTVKSYKTYIGAYLDYLENTLGIAPEDANWQIMRDFVFYLQRERGISDRTVNMAISQLRFFTLYVLHQTWDPTQIPFRRYDTYLPIVPSQEEVRLFICSIDDIKLKAIVMLLYSAGLRVGEVCNLRYEDVNRRNMRIHIQHGKNRSDRYAILAQTTLDTLTDYWFQSGKPYGFLFHQANHPEKPISTYWVNRHIHIQEQKLGWPERFTPHTFRHAFGTHLYENGTDLLTIKSLLGHRSINSTAIYVHLAASSTQEIISPLDRLMSRT